MTSEPTAPSMLPIGPKQVAARELSGVLARSIEGWNMSWIFNVTSGAPTSIGGATHAVCERDAGHRRSFRFRVSVR